MWKGFTEYLHFGISEKCEVGFTRLREKVTVVNAKYCFETETAKRIGIAAGIEDVTDAESSVLYAVASKTFDPDLFFVGNFHANLGIAAFGKRTVDTSKGNIPTSLQLNGFFAGLTFDVVKLATAVAEYDGRNINFGLRATFFRDFTATAGFVGPSHKIAAGVSYQLKL